MKFLFDFFKKIFPWLNLNSAPDPSVNSGGVFVYTIPFPGFFGVTFVPINQYETPIMALLPEKQGARKETGPKPRFRKRRRKHE